MSKKILSKQESLRKRVYEFYLNNKDSGKKYTLDHFIAENIPESTIYDIIKRAENRSGHERVPGSGRTAQIMTNKGLKRLERMFNNKDGVSQRQAARKFNCSQKHISKTLSTKLSISARKKIRIPKRSEQQKEQAQTKCSRLFQKLQGKLCIIDDESYFTLAHTNINGNGRFYTSDISKTPSNIKFKPVEKYPKKLLV